MKKSLPVLIFSLLLLSCRKENTLDCFRPNGAFITENRTLKPFHYIEVYDNMDVFIKQGPVYTAEVRSGKNIISDIKTTLEDSVLKIQNLNICNFMRGYKKRTSVTITVPEIIKVSNNGVGPVTFADDFQQEELKVRAESSGNIYINGTYDEIYTSSHGNGDIYLSGNARSLQIYTYGTNYTRAEHLIVTDYVFLTNLSLGDIILNGTQLVQLDYLIFSDGNVKYTGEPKIIRHLGTAEDARGKLIKID